MLVTVIATLCQVASPQSCQQVTITQQATLSQCEGNYAQGAISKWMSESIRFRTGWSLSKWGCVIGATRGKDI